MTRKKDRLEPINIETLATLMRRAIDSAYSATLVGNPAPVTSEYFKRTKAPQAGDLVIESSTVYRMRHANATDLDGIGILEKIAWETIIWDDPEFVWDEIAEGRPEPKEQVFYIRTFDGRLFRWTNATIIAAVTDSRL